MKYKIYLDALQCDRFCSDFMRGCDLGIDAVGIPVVISFTINKKPTKKVINKIIECHMKSKDNIELDNYLTNVKLNRIEVIK